MKAVIFACRLEADPFIAKFAFKQIESKPFEVFQSGENFVFISGIGPLAAALCAVCAIRRKASEILNAGACGDLKRVYPLGAVLNVSAVISCEPYCSKIFKLSEGGATLVTSSRPVEADIIRAELSRKADIVDMEAYGILSAMEFEGFAFKNFKALKFVSDFSEACDIEKNIAKHILCLAPHIDAWMK